MLTTRYPSREIANIAPIATSLLAFTVAVAAFGGSTSFLLLLAYFALLAAISVRLLLVTYLIAFAFQSSIISIFSPHFSSRGEMAIVQGISFVLICVGAARGYLFLLQTDRKHIHFKKIQNIIATSLIACLVCILYYFIGIMSNGFQNASIYLRSAISVTLLSVFGVYCGMVLGSHRVIFYLKCIAVPAVIFGMVEIFAPYSLYDIFNTLDFFALKHEGRHSFASLNDVVEFAQRPLFNLAAFRELDIYTFRAIGPNMHSISYAYMLAIMSVIFAIDRQWYFTILCIAIMISIQAKGPLIVLILSYLFMACFRFFPRSLAILLVALGAFVYVSLALVYGIHTRDFHVLGLLGGVNGFLENPLGHGLGAGGNLSRESFSWDDFQNAGAASFGLESAVGVLLYQMGIGTVAILLYYLRFLSWSIEVTEKDRDLRKYRILALMFFVALLNGIFQEEAYNPFALGLLAFIISSILGSTLMAKGDTQERTSYWRQSFAKHFSG